MTDARAAALADDLISARSAFLDALRGRGDAPSAAGAWGARELLAHLGYWVGDATEAIHRAEVGEAELFGAGAPETDERNATVARVAGQASVASVRAREAAAVEALLDRLRALPDPTLLDTPLPSGRTLEEEVRVHGPSHYRGHAQELSRPRAGGD